jgi:hypothetical protein
LAGLIKRNNTKTPVEEYWEWVSLNIETLIEKITISTILVKKPLSLFAKRIYFHF